MRKQSVFLVLTVAAAVALMGQTALGAYVTVVNGDFESGGAGAGWHPGWSAWNPAGTSPSWWGQQIAAGSTQPPGGPGSQYHSIQMVGGGWGSQDLGVAALPNTTYTVFCDVRTLWAGYPTGDTGIELWAGDPVTGTFLAFAGMLNRVDNPNWQNFQASYSTGASGGVVGQNLILKAVQSDAHPGSGGTNDEYAFMDNVRLWSEPVPEPVTMSLLGLGSLMLLRRRRRG